MQLKTEIVGPGVTKVDLTGRMDIAGAAAIDLHFNVLVGSERALIVDLSEVSFIASMGLRTLIMGARSVASKGGRMILLNPNPNVEEVLRTIGIEALVGIVRTLDDAIQAVSA